MNRDMKEVAIRLVSIFITFLIFLGFFMLMKELKAPIPVQIAFAIVLIVIVDYIKSKIFKR